jgi:acylpyruvate hydrolase
VKLSTVRLGQGRTAAARLQKKHCVVLPYPDVGALIASGEDWRERAAEETGERHRLDDISYAPLITRPSKIVRVGPNYAARVRETGISFPTVPVFSVRQGGQGVAGARDTICLPAEGRNVDWGVELGLVIGCRTRGVTARTALRHVAGYTVVNGVAARSDSGSAPASGLSTDVTLVGPAMVTTDDVPMGGRGLTMSCVIDGRVRQRANTSQLIFDVATVIAHVSTVITLLPGDLITMGRPAGCGTVSEPEVLLYPGVDMVTEIKGVGELRNSVVRSGSQ